MIDKAKILLNKDWSEQQHALIKRLFDNLISYKAFIPGALKNDIIAMLDIAISIKDDYENLKSKEKAIIKECIHDMIHDKVELIDNYSQTDNIKSEVSQLSDNISLHQPFSLVVSETGTITFTIKSKIDKENEKNNDNHKNEELNNKRSNELPYDNHIQEEQDTLKLDLNIEDDTEIIEKEEMIGCNELDKKKRKKYRWRSLFCF